MAKVSETVISIIAKVLQENGIKAPSLSPSSRVLQDTGLDSLMLAEVVVRLEEHFGKDPFNSGFISFTTIEEFSRLYE